MKDTGIIILAAGNSSRLGRPKQLLTFGEGLLVQHIADESIKSNPCAVVVVTGAYATEVAASLSGKEVDIVFNPQWQLGMASGIAAGVARLRILEPNTTGAILVVCDQPFVTEGVLQQLVQAREKTGKRIVACTYADTVGTPVLFDAFHFEELMKLEGTEGAKSLVQKHKHGVATLLFPAGSIDIDTEDDYRHLMANFK